MTKDEALKLALHGLEMGVTLIEDFGSKEQLNTQHKAIAAIYEALAQPEQKPVAVVRWNDIGHISWRTHVMLSDDTPLYTAPPQRKPLTDEQIADLYFDKFSMGELKAFARAIEAAHGIKGEA